VYKAEKVLRDHFENQTFETTDNVVAYIHRLTQETWFRAVFRPIVQIRVRDGRGCVDSASGGRLYAYGVKMTLPRSMRTTWVILHELAHGIQTRDSEAHGPEFCALYIYLVKYVMGPKAAGALCHSFKSHGVRYQPFDLIGSIDEQVQMLDGI